MKKKIYLGLFLLILCFLAGGIYISKSIDTVTDKLETIITLHKVEFLRETLLNKIIVVQGDLLLKDTLHFRQVDTFIQHVEEMHQTAMGCLDCHHEEQVKQRLDHFNSMIDGYIKKLSRIYTLRANEQRLKKEKRLAFDIGQAVIEQVSSILITSAHKTSQRIYQARNNINKTKHFLFALMIIGPLFILFTFHFFLRQFTRAVTTLNNATRKIKEGQLDFRIKDQLKDEFREMATSFNEMAVSLNEQQTGRLAAIGELAAGLAHEVKNPLAGMKVSIEVLKNELDLKQEDKEIFLKIINEINRIDSLLKNMLNYARPSTPRPHYVNIHEILSAIIKISKFSLRSPSDTSGLTKDILFVTDFAADMPHIFADPKQLQQVFLNLILNGIDAITEKGAITIKTEKTPADSVQIRISDTGKGVDPEQLNMVFNPFFTTKTKGTGLGLAICKRLIEQQNGTIKVFNNTDGVGVTFVITLPEIQESKGATP